MNHLNILKVHREYQTSIIVLYNYFILLSDYKLCIKNVVINLSLTGFGVTKLRPIGLMNMLYTTGTEV